MGNGGEYEDDQGESKPATRSRGKKGSGSTPSSQPTNGRRKADETPTKTPAKKRAKGNSGSATKMPDFDDDDDDDDSSIKDEGEGSSGLNSSGKKMTDEEKRKNFLERNRLVRWLPSIGLRTDKSFSVAALKCRQRKKQWLANLQTKVEIFTSENDALTAQCSSLREEIINLKTLLLAHKDCPVSHSQGLGGNNMVQVMGDVGGNQSNPYGIAMNGNQMMGMQPNQGGMQRR